MLNEHDVAELIAAASLLEAHARILSAATHGNANIPESDLIEAIEAAQKVSARFDRLEELADAVDRIAEINPAIRNYANAAGMLRLRALQLMHAYDDYLIMTGTIH